MNQKQAKILRKYNKLTTGGSTLYYRKLKKEFLSKNRLEREELIKMARNYVT